MNYKISYTHPFAKELKHLAKKYPSIKADVSNLIKELQINPLMGIPIGNNFYKIRLAIQSKGKGKSGGARVITYVQVVNENIFWEVIEKLKALGAEGILVVPIEKMIM